MLSFKRKQVARTPGQGALDILHAYGEVLESSNLRPVNPTDIFDVMRPDVSKLPYPKPVIDAAITYLMDRVLSKDEFEKLATGRTFLATYQDYADLQARKLDVDQVSLDEMNAIADNKIRREQAGRGF